MKVLGSFKARSWVFLEQLMHTCTLFHSKQYLLTIGVKMIIFRVQCNLRSWADCTVAVRLAQVRFWAGGEREGEGGRN